MYLLNIDKRGEIIETDDGLYAIEEFRNVVEEFGLKGILWVALVCDYDSPYRHFVEREQVKSVSKAVFDTYNWKGIRNEKSPSELSKTNIKEMKKLLTQLKNIKSYSLTH